MMTRRKNKPNILDEYVEIEELLQDQGIDTFSLGIQIGYDIGMEDRDLSSMAFKIAPILYQKNILGIYEPVNLKNAEIRKKTYKKLKKQKLLPFFEMIIKEAKKRVNINIIDELYLEGEENGK